MREIKKIKGSNLLQVYNDSILVWNKNYIQQINSKLELQTLVEDNIYTVKVLDNMLLYQLNNEWNIYMYRTNASLMDSFTYGLISALKCDIYIYIPSKRYSTSIFLDDSLKFVGNAPQYCRASFKNYLFDYDNNSLICYELSKELWNYQYPSDSKLNIVSGYDDKVIIYSDSGDLFALNLKKGSVDWQYGEKCQYTIYCLFDDKIYNIYKNEFREISAETGKLIRYTDISSLRQEKEFVASAGIKAYDKYIFGRDVNGMIIVIERSTLKLQEVIHFDKHLMNDENALHWVNNRLYVQDVDYTIHVFE